MPSMPKRGCSVPGCPEIAGDSGMCEYHRKKYRRESSRDRRWNEKRPNTSERGYGSRWQKIRKAYLSRNPICNKCERKGRTTAADTVHHIIDIKNGGTHNLDNLMALCRDCHERVHGRLY